jgi:hypothetical protein
MRILQLLLPLLFICVENTTARLEIPTPDGREILNYDPIAVSRGDLERWAQLSEDVAAYNSYMGPESLELCIADSPEYAQCGSRDLKDPNFLHNAKINISKIENRIVLLKSGRFPEQLKPVVNYFLRIQTTFLTFRKAELQFLQDGNSSDLDVNADGIDYAPACAPVVNRVNQIEDRHKAYLLVSHDWLNCVNNVFSQHHGYEPYPKSAWEGFLAHYGIQERFVPAEVDD